MSRPRRALSLLVTVALGAFLIGCSREPSEDTARLSLVLVVVDTLRADGLDPEGLNGTTMPHIGRLADTGTQFTSAIAVSPWTGPSVSSIVTGKYPNELQIHSLRAPLPDWAITLAQRFSAAGYVTSAVISNEIAGPAFGHDRGYDHFYIEPYKQKRATAKDPRFRPPSFTADRVTDKALEWLDGYLNTKEDSSAPFFLHVHYTDPHEPYLAPTAQRSVFLEGREPLSDDYMLERKYLRAEPTPAQLETIKASYRAEVAFADKEIGRLLDRLPAGTLVVLTSDHGEEFFEHRGFLHGHSLYEELLNVPLIIRGPGVPGGVRVSDIVSHVDIAPTVLDLTGVDPMENSDLSGKSLSRYFAGPVEREDPVYSILDTKARLWFSVRRDEWKLHVFAKRGQTKLVNIRDDPGETQDLSELHPEIAAELLRLGEEWQRRAVDAPAGPDDEADRERLEALRSIGYIGGGN